MTDRRLPIIGTAGPEDVRRADWVWVSPESLRARVTRRAFTRALKEGSMELLLAWDSSGMVLGQLYIVLQSYDRRFADGHGRGYLCALTVRPGFRGRGMGTALVEVAAKHLVGLGFAEVTIGVDEDAPQVEAMYRKWGFTRSIGRLTVDPWGLDEEGRPQKVPPFILLCRRL